MAIPSSSSPTSPDLLTEVLGRLGLTEYFQVLCDNGFHSWEAVVDITEDDMTALNFKLGHRRLLQREIATYRGVPQSLSLEPESNSPEPTSLSTSALESFTRQTTTPPPREKRRYRRHPRPDPNAPKKPKTAYVNFADELRTDPEVSQLSFVDIAREVGRRWQELPAEKKRTWESNAARAMQEFEAQMDEYKKTDSWRKYQSYLNDFKTQQSSASLGKQRPGNLSRSTTDTSNNTRPYSRASPSSSDSPASLPSTASLGPGAEACHNALTLALSELVTLRSEIINKGSQQFGENLLPPEDRVRRCMYSFIRGTGSILFMWTYEQTDAILDRIYRPQTKVDDMTLAECFAIAAMGAHYDTDVFPETVRRALYASGACHFNEKVARQDDFRTMRLLLSLSFYSILEKHMSAKYLIGLQIARWKWPAAQGPQSMDGSWKNIFRSLIFMDSWLSYTLGYPCEVTPDDTKTACAVHQPDQLSVDELIHMQSSKINLIAAEVAKTLASPKLTTKGNITLLTQKLEQWRQEVPYALQIPTLLSSESQDMTVFQRRAIFMVHIMYLGALILLYRQLLVAAAEAQLTDGTACALNNISADEVKMYRQECTIAAQNIARMLGLISFDGTLTRRCWIIIYWSFSAAICLLFSATTKLMEGQVEGVEADLAYAKSCMDMLEPCKPCEPVAAQYLEILWPLYDNLQDVLRRMIGRSKSSIFAILQPDPSLLSPPVPVSKQEMGPISEKLTMLLTDPFGRKQDVDGTRRRILSNDGCYSVFWFR
ncbi:hmg box protein [Stemphylium lycopersici]|uniref:Hmg box protein n=1 Tax=Stemphylium lycopersici TaxID=183478 RepID=A0A364MXF7_STELY|nr:hmg box protein [Stemphylium lycopersici]